MRYPGSEKLEIIPYGQKSALTAGTSGRLSMVIAQEPAQSLAAPDGSIAVAVRVPRKQQDVTLPLVIPLSMEILGVFAERPPQRALAKEDHLGQALLLHRPDPALRIGIQVRAARGKHERLDPA